MKKTYYTILMVLHLFLLNSCQQSEITIYVSPSGSDANPGTMEDPIASLEQAEELLQKYAGDYPVTVSLREGTYYITKPITHTSENSGNLKHPIRYTAYNNEKVVISTSKVLKDLEWKQYNGNIIYTEIKDIATFDQLFVNGDKQHVARYPNYSTQTHHFNGYAADAISPEKVKKWKNPTGGIIHAMHRHEWGGYQYLIKGKDDKNNLLLDGGFQNNRQMGMHDKYRMVENIFEELDAENEWYYDSSNQLLYYYPPTGMDIANAFIEVPQLESIFVLKGTEEKPVQYISIEGLELKHTLHTFMKTKEPLLRSDWTIYRGGAISIEGAKNCEISDCSINNVGGNAIFFSNYNSNNLVEKNHIAYTGASGVCFVGSPDAVRSPSFEYNQAVPFEKLNLEKGPKNSNYPMNCKVDNNLIHDIGLLEKQVAGVQISMAQNITVSHNSIYNLPRAGVNISEGTWGGHLLEWNDVFNTVLETGDHGAFNSWGRDRFWLADRRLMDSIMKVNPELVELDAVATTIIRYNRWRCDHGWDIDLDDGSSNYHIYNNLCLNGGLKLREGFNRIVENNIMINNSFHPHVWFQNSKDVFKHNIVTRPYYPIGINHWGQEIDHNLLPDFSSLNEAKSNGTDTHSLSGNPMFIDSENGNYGVKDNSPALQVGFKNFPMNEFGVQYKKLKDIAQTPPLPQFKLIGNENNGGNEIYNWLGAKLKNLTTEGERSATGMDGIRGVLLIELDNSELAKVGLTPHDVIIRYQGQEINGWNDLEKEIAKSIRGSVADIVVFRDQKETTFKLQID